MKKIIPILYFVSLVACQRSEAQETDKIIKQGNELYKKGDFAGAGEQYQKATPDERAKFNFGDALYKQKKINEAANLFKELGESNSNEDLRSKAYYNKGVIYSVQKKLEESIEAYKNALRLNPADIQARENLQKALMELRKKTPPKKEEKKNQPPPRKQPQPKINQKQAEQKLKQLEQKEKETQQRVQKKPQAVNAQIKDW